MKISDLSSRPWRNVPPPTWAIHMATRRPAHNTPIHMDFLYRFLSKRHQVHVDRRVAGWSTGRHVDHPCGGLISPWSARKVTEKNPHLLVLVGGVSWPFLTIKLGIFENFYLTGLRKIKGQQLNGKIVSEIFTVFLVF